MQGIKLKLTSELIEVLEAIIERGFLSYLPSQSQRLKITLGILHPNFNKPFPVQDS